MHRNGGGYEKSMFVPENPGVLLRNVSLMNNLRGLQFIRWHLVLLIPPDFTYRRRFNY